MKLLVLVLIKKNVKIEKILIKKYKILLLKYNMKYKFIKLINIKKFLNFIYLFNIK